MGRFQSYATREVGLIKMSQARPFTYSYERDGSAAERASAMNQLAHRMTDEASFGWPQPGNLGIVGISLTLLEHQPSAPRSSIAMRVGQDGAWRVLFDGVPNDAVGMSDAWSYYQQLLYAVNNERAPAEHQQRTIRRLRFGGESIQLAMGTRYRVENKTPSKRRQHWETSTLLWRTFAYRGHEASMGVLQRAYASHRLFGVAALSDGGVGSEYSYRTVGRHGQPGGRIKGMPETWASELEQQFGTHILIAALTPCQWQEVIQRRFTEEDIMKERV